MLNVMQAAWKRRLLLRLNNTIIARIDTPFQRELHLLQYVQTGHNNVI